MLCYWCFASFLSAPQPRFKDQGQFGLPAGVGYFLIICSEGGGSFCNALHSQYILVSLSALLVLTYQQKNNMMIQVDEGEWEVCSQVTALCIGNAKYFGGGMEITPNANPSSGDYEVE